MQFRTWHKRAGRPWRVQNIVAILYIQLNKDHIISYGALHPSSGNYQISPIDQIISSYGNVCVLRFTTFQIMSKINPCWHKEQLYINLF